MTGSEPDDEGPTALTVRDYYRAIDTGAYEDLERALAPGFVQRRPDRTIEGRESFVRFMREDRPTTETTHRLEEVFATDDRALARGRLLDDDGRALFGFADVFSIEEGRIAAIETYTR